MKGSIPMYLHISYYGRGLGAAASSWVLSLWYAHSSNPTEVFGGPVGNVLGLRTYMTQESRVASAHVIT
jgi:hypothetical protein